MDKKYSQWISDNVPETYGTCAEVTEEMQDEFPELKRVRGHYLCSSWGSRSHWWCVTPDGQVVDPTADQFPSLGSGVYTPWDETKDEPTGMCMNCGEYVYSGRISCSNKCQTLLEAYYNIK